MKVKWEDSYRDLQLYRESVDILKSELNGAIEEEKFYELDSIRRKVDDLKEQWRNCKLLNQYLHFENAEKVRLKLNRAEAERILTEENQQLKTQVRELLNSETIKVLPLKCEIERLTKKVEELTQANLALTDKKRELESKATELEAKLVEYQAQTEVFEAIETVKTTIDALKTEQIDLSKPKRDTSRV